MLKAQFKLLKQVPRIVRDLKKRGKQTELFNSSYVFVS